MSPLPAGGPSASWLTEVLRPQLPAAATDPPCVVDVRVEPLGTGIGLLGTVQRLILTWSGSDGPSRVVVKRPSSIDDNRAVAERFDMHRTEVRFYRDLGAATRLAIPCHHAEVDESSHEFVIVLDDLSGDVVLDQVVGCPPAQAVAVVTALADLHACHWEEAGLSTAPWLRTPDHPDLVRAFQESLRTAWPVVRSRFAAELASSTVELCERLEELVPVVTRALSRPPVTLVHGDARLDNMFFADSGRVALCDWQLTGRSRGVRDLAFFLTQSLSPADRASYERPLVDAYLARLAQRGVVDYDVDQSWDDYRSATLLGLFYAVIAGGAIDPQNPRGIALVGTMLQRAAAAVDDHGCASLG
jgi:aminoglycoside phosphotransferase (APT) family kinase protein